MATDDVNALMERFPFVADFGFAEGKIQEILYKQGTTEGQQVECFDYLKENNLLYIGQDTPSEPAPQPDWEGAIIQLSNKSNPLRIRLKASDETTALGAFYAECHQAAPRFPVMKVHWDTVMEGLPVPLTAEERAGFKQFSDQFNLGLSLDANNYLVQS